MLIRSCVPSQPCTHSILLTSNWCSRMELNHRRGPLQDPALPLSYESIKLLRRRLNQHERLRLVEPAIGVQSSSKKSNSRNLRAGFEPASPAHLAGILIRYTNEARDIQQCCDQISLVILLDYLTMMISHRSKNCCLLNTSSN